MIIDECIINIPLRPYISFGKLIMASTLFTLDIVLNQMIRWADLLYLWFIMSELKLVKDVPISLPL